jgi:hypothetical protein
MTSIAIFSGCQTTGLKTWGENRNIPEEYRPNLETVRHHFLAYNNRGTSSRFNVQGSHKPRELLFDLRDSKIVKRELADSYLASYLAYEDGKVVVDEVSPDGRLGDLFDDETPLYSMSLGKTLTGYLVGHAICKGYIESLHAELSDWPLIRGTLIEDAKISEVINATMGNQQYMKSGNELRSGRDVGDLTLRAIVQSDLKNSKPDNKRFAYGDLPPIVALNYVAYRTADNFQRFLNEVLQDHVGLKSELQINHNPDPYFSSGLLKPNFKATRYDTLRLGIAMLEDWNRDNCVGRYLKDVYAGRVKKGYRQGDGYSKAYAGFFHTDYPGIEDKVMGMDGYGGIALLINFDKNRIVYAHAVHRDYNYRKIILGPIEEGRF